MNKIINGVVVELTTEEEAAWIAANTPTVDQVRRRMWREVKDIRDNRVRNGGVLLVDKWYPTTVEAKTQILWVIAMGSSVPTSQRIELMDGSMNNLSYGRANDLLTAAAAQAAAITDYADSLKVLVDASSNPSSIDINVGWPAVYVPA